MYWCLTLLSASLFHHDSFSIKFWRVLTMVYITQNYWVFKLCPLSGISSIFIEHFEKLALDLARHKSSLWYWNVEDVFVVSPYGPERVKNFLSHLSSLRPSFQFTYQTVHFTFWVFWPPKSTGNPLTLADISTSTRTVRLMWKEVWFRIFTIELPHYAKND
jgi:hypothetical protein